MKLLKRLTNLWNLSEKAPEATEIKFHVGQGEMMSFPIKKAPKKASIIPFKKKDSVKDFVGEESAITN